MPVRHGRPLRIRCDAPSRRAPSSGSARAGRCAAAGPSRRRISALRPARPRRAPPAASCRRRRASAMRPATPATPRRTGPATRAAAATRAGIARAPAIATAPRSMAMPAARARAPHR